MGSQVFTTVATATTAAQAFTRAVEDACWQHGNDGYSGSIAEKWEFVMIPCLPGQTAEDTATILINNSDPRIDDKWGPAGCIDMGDGDYLFFGWASS